MFFSWEKIEAQKKLARLYEEYRQLLYVVAFRILQNSKDAEDAVHETFVRVFEHLEKINENECHKTKAFLVTVTKHISFDLCCSRKRERGISYEEWEEAIGKEPSGQSSGGDFYEALGKLPENYLNVLLLKYSHGYDDREIAQMLDITEENVRQRISRAKKRLSEMLEKEGETK